ncbi:MAG: RAMP superfamily CRISPR-associated protein [Cyanobacteria bacterium P01_A01_bin.17]
MHKQLVNQCTIHLSLIPQGPILIKSGSQGADPTKADMEFVETYHDGEKRIYLPGSSLKGAIRAHAERIVRTVGGDQPTSNGVWANDSTTRTKGANRHVNSSTGISTYQTSSFTEQMFGNTALASRLRIEDAYATVESVLEERNGIAIDRVLGSQSGSALFNYEVCTSGQFTTRIHLRNFSLAQLGLLGLVLRDLHEGWFAIGFGKSRGLGNVSVEYHSAIVQYPGCELRGDKIYPIGKPKATPWHKKDLLGAGEFLGKGNAYGFPHPDRQTGCPVSAEPSALGFGVKMNWPKQYGVEDLFRRSVENWKQQVRSQGVAK